MLVVELSGDRLDRDSHFDEKLETATTIRMAPLNEGFVVRGFERRPSVDFRLFDETETRTDDSFRSIGVQEV